MPDSEEQRQLTKLVGGQRPEKYFPDPEVVITRDGGLQPPEVAEHKTRDQTNAYDRYSLREKAEDK